MMTRPQADRLILEAARRGDYNGMLTVRREAAICGITYSATEWRNSFLVICRANEKRLGEDCFRDLLDREEA
jgi:hypothetical protein